MAIDPPNRAKNSCSVFKAAWPISLGPGGLLLSAFFVWYLQLTHMACISDAVRYAGVLLQIMGLLTVAIGLWKLRRAFHQSSLIAGIIKWLRQLATSWTNPDPSVDAVTGTARVGENADALTAKGAVTGIRLENRMEHLETEIQNLKRQLVATDKELRGELERVREATRLEGQKRKSKLEKIESQIEEVAIGGLHLEATGLVWLTFGVIAATIPDEIASLIDRMSVALA